MISEVVGNQNDLSKLRSRVDYASCLDEQAAKELYLARVGERCMLRRTYSSRVPCEVGQYMDPTLLKTDIGGTVDGSCIGFGEVLGSRCLPEVMENGEEVMWRYRENVYT